MTPNSRESHCRTCGRTFVTEQSFDLHRGIQQRPRREDAQDAGRCLDAREMARAGITQESGRWGTQTEHATAVRFAAMREARGRGETSA